MKRKITVSIDKHGDGSYLGLAIMCKYGSIVPNSMDPIGDCMEVIALRYMINEIRNDAALNQAVDLVLPTDDELDAIR